MIDIDNIRIGDKIDFEFSSYNSEPVRGTAVVDSIYYIDEEVTVRNIEWDPRNPSQFRTPREETYIECSEITKVHSRYVTLAQLMAEGHNID